MDLKVVELEIPEGSNIIVGQSHFIKTAEDLYEAIAGTAPGAKFGLAFSEASGPCLVRLEGNDPALKEAARNNSLALACGHTFVVLMKDAFPINVLNAIKAVQEVCGIFCATANPVQVVVAQTGQGRGIMGVIDGSMPLGVEGEQDVSERRSLLRRFGYKL
ncbi:MAG: adenosine monophosphate-protein transferase [Methanosarcinales archaeon]|nr:adenosine monophosphate-protein transferase [Methanosarcinales archaeon]